MLCISAEEENELRRVEKRMTGGGSGGKKSLNMSAEWLRPLVTLLCFNVPPNGQLNRPLPPPNTHAPHPRRPNMNRKRDCKEIGEFLKMNLIFQSVFLRYFFFCFHKIELYK